MTEVRYVEFSTFSKNLWLSCIVIIYCVEFGICFALIIIIIILFCILS